MKKQMIRSKYGKIVLNSVEDRDIDNDCRKYLETKENNINQKRHSVKSIRVWNYSSPYFPA